MAAATPEHCKTYPKAVKDDVASLMADFRKVASTSGDAALVDRSAELLEKLANMRIGSNKAEAAPNGDELAKVFQAMLRTTYDSEETATKVASALHKLVDTAAASRGAVEAELYSELRKASNPTSRFNKSHGDEVGAASLEDWRESIAKGSLAEHFNSGMDMWLPVKVVDVDATRGVRIQYEDVVSIASPIWVRLSAQVLAPRGRHTITPEQRLAAEPWRLALKPGDSVDLISSGGIFVKGTLTDTWTRAAPPTEAVVMFQNKAMVEEVDAKDGGEAAAPAKANDAPAAADASNAEDAAAGAEAPAAESDDDGVVRFVRVMRLSDLQRSTIVPANLPWTPVWSLRLAEADTASCVKSSFGIATIPATQLGQREVLLPGGGPVCDSDDAPIGDGSLAAALRAPAEAVVLPRGPGRDNGGSLAVAFISKVLTSGALGNMLRRAAAMKRLPVDAAHFEAHADQRSARSAEYLASHWLAGVTSLAAAAEAGAGDPFEGAAAVVRDALGPADEADAGAEGAPRVATLTGMLGMLEANVALLNKHWVAAVAPVLALLITRALCCQPPVARRLLRPEDLAKVNSTLRMLLHRGIGRTAGVALLELCSLELSECMLRQDMLQQRILGMRLYTEAAQAAATKEAVTVDMESLERWLDETEFFDIVFTQSRSHEELYRRVGAVIKNLLRAGSDASDIVERLWESGTGPRANAEIRDLCFSQLQDMASELNVEATASILVRICQMPRATITTQIVRLAVSLMNVSQEKAVKLAPIGLNILWSLAFEPATTVRVAFAEPAADAPKAPRPSAGERVLSESAKAEHAAAVEVWRTADFEAAGIALEAAVAEDDSTLGAPSPEVAAEAETSFASLLKQQAHDRMKVPFCARVLARVKSGSGSRAKLLSIMWAVINDCPAVSSRPTDLSRSMLLSRLQGSFGLLESVLASVVGVHESAKAHAAAQGWVPDGGIASASLAELRDLGSKLCAWTPSGDDSDFITSMRTRLGVLVNACEASESLHLSGEQAKTLYSCLVSDALCPQETELLSRHLRSAAAGSLSAVGEVMTSATMIDLFRSSMLAESPRRMQLADLRALVPYFLLANGAAGALDLRSTRPGEDPEFLVRKLPQEMEGFEYLWRVALEADDDEVGSRAVQFLSSLHSQFSPAFESENKDARPEAVRAEFVSSIVRRLRDAVEEGRWSMAGRCLVAADQLLREADETGVAESGVRPHGSLASRGSPLVVSFSCSIPAKHFSGGSEKDPPAIVSDKPAPPAKFRLRLPGAATVSEMRGVLAEFLGFSPAVFRLAVAGKVWSPEQNSRSLTQMGIKTADTVLLSLKIQRETTAPLLANPSVSDQRSAKLTPAAEKVVMHIFHRFCNEDGLMGIPHFRDFCRGAGVSDEQNLSDSRLGEVFRNAELDPSGMLALKGFIQFYTEAAFTRPGNVLSDFRALGYDTTTMTIPTEDGPGDAGASPADRAKQRRQAAADRRDRALEVRAMSRRILVAPESGIHSALFGALTAPPEFDEAVVQRSWAMLMALPTEPSVLSHVGGGAEAALLVPVKADLVEDAKPAAATAAASAPSPAASGAGAAASDAATGGSGAAAALQSAASDSGEAAVATAEPEAAAEPVGTTDAEPDAEPSLDDVAVNLSAVDWAAELDSASPFKLLYVLQVLQMLAAEAPRARKPAPPAQSNADPANALPVGTSAFIGPLAPDQYDNGARATDAATGGAAVSSDSPADDASASASDEESEPKRYAAWREQFIRTGGLRRLLSLLRDWDASSLAEVERAEGSEAASTADGLRRSCVAELFALARTFVGPALEARSAAAGASEPADADADDEDVDGEPAATSAAGAPGTSSGPDAPDDDAASTDATNGRDAAEPSDITQPVGASGAAGASAGAGGDASASPDSLVEEQSMSAASSKALLAQLAGELGEAVVDAADPDRFVGSVLHLVSSAAQAATAEDVKIVQLGLGLVSSLAMQRPASLAPLLVEPPAAGEKENWLSQLVPRLLLHSGSDSSTRIRRFASSKFGAMVASIPDEAFKAAGAPALADFLLELLLERLDEVASAAERAVAVATAAAAAAEDASAAAAATNDSATDTSNSDAAAACVQFFSLLTRILRHMVALSTESPAVELTARPSAEVPEAVAAAAPPAGASASPLEVRLMPVAKSLMRRVTCHPPLERRGGTEQVDQLLMGVLKVLATLADGIPALRSLAAEPGTGVPGKPDDTFMRVVFEDCLFFQPTTAEDLDETVAPVLPKCKRARTRAAAFALLSALARGQPSNVARMSDSLVTVMDAVKGDKPSQSALNPNLSRRAACGYVGLRNLGCICYMNSMMQQLFMVPHFRFGVLAADCEVTDDDTHDGTRDIPNDVADAVKVWKEGAGAKGAAVEGGAAAVPTPASESPLYQLQRMFASLSMSQRRDYDPRPWCNSFKDSGGNPVNVGIQQDAEEFVNAFLNKVSESLKGSKQHSLVRDCFTGTTVDQMCCPEFQWIREKRTVFHHLPLTVANNSDVYEALRGSIECETLSEYKCDAAPDTPTQLEKRQVLGQLPDTLMLHFKRMVFDFDTFLNKKINTRFAFPHELDMYAFTREGVMEEERIAAQAGGATSSFLSALRAKGDPVAAAAAMGADAAAAAASGAGEAAAADGAAPSTSSGARARHEDGRLKSPSDEYLYDLAGIVVHTGTAQSGHYFSFIKDRATGRWFEFNDSTVRPFDPKDIPDKCFGGTGKGRAVSRFGYVSDVQTERTLNAYFTVYECRKPSRVRQAVSVTAAMHGIAFEAAAVESRPFDPLARAQEVEAEIEKYKEEEDRAKHRALLEAQAKAAEADSAAFTGKLLELARSAAAEGDKSSGRIQPSTLLRSLLPKAQFDRIFSDNARMVRQGELYSGEFFGFIGRTFTEAAPALVAALTGASDARDASAMTAKEASGLLDVGSSFALRVMVKSTRDVKQVPAMLEALSRVYAEHPPSCASLLLQLAADPDWIRELLLLATNKKIRSAVASLITMCLSRCAAAEPGALWAAENFALAAARAEAEAKADAADASNDAGTGKKKEDATPAPPAAHGAPGDGPSGAGAAEGPQSTVRAFIDAMLSLLPKVDSAWARFEEYWGILADAADIPFEEVCRFLAHRNMLRIMFDFVLGEDSPIKDSVRPDGRKIPPMGSAYSRPSWNDFFRLWRNITCSAKLPPHLRVSGGANCNLSKWRRKQAAAGTSLLGAEAQAAEARWRVAEPPTTRPMAFQLPLGPDGNPDMEVWAASVAKAEECPFMRSSEVSAPFQPLYENSRLLGVATRLGVDGAILRDIACHLAFESQDASALLCSTMASEVSCAQNDEAHRKVVQIIIDGLVSIEDSLQEQRIFLVLGDHTCNTLRAGTMLGFEPKDPPKEPAAAGDAVAAEGAATPGGEATATAEGAAPDASAPAPAPAPAAEEQTAEEKQRAFAKRSAAVSAGISRDFLYSVSCGHTGGIISWMLKSQRTYTQAVAERLSWLLDLMVEVPAIARYVFKLLPPVAPSRHKTMGDWMIEFATWAAHISTMGRGMPLKHRREEAIAFLHRVRAEVEGHAKALDFEVVQRLSPEQQALNDRALGWTQLLEASLLGFCVATGTLQNEDGSKSLCVRYCSRVDHALKVTVFLTDQQSPTKPANFRVTATPEDPKPEADKPEADKPEADKKANEAGDAAAAKEAADVGDQPKPVKERFRFVNAPFQCGVLTVREAIDPAKPFGLYDFNWLYDHLYDPEAQETIPTARAEGTTVGGFALEQDLEGWSPDPVEAENLSGCDRCHFVLASTKGAGSASTRPTSNASMSWREREAQRPADERVFGSDDATDSAELQQLIAMGILSMVPQMRDCRSCGQQFSRRELRCPSCNTYAASN
ncbi:hypothetical protein FNF29_05837 [Cafeteria roenbergensis]|uniref:USP domain-containing protein n=1 Tax=Cafeteria roenbergensis TaxID=33653 RepID=A0A5A8C9P6_CAFRO|nr:hypothetical protein FNF29_05837 [Cafeteria roenbergensis]|eukprot:KAA0149625.1 hypothetical protein FNF29_05837 [Cafeteria roenbergensis]